MEGNGKEPQVYLAQEPSGQDLPSERTSIIIIIIVIIVSTQDQTNVGVAEELACSITVRVVTRAETGHRVTGSIGSFGSSSGPGHWV